MRLKIDLVEGWRESEGLPEMVADFVIDGLGLYPDHSGICACGRVERWPYDRTVYIGVVRQNDLWRTLRVLGHELLHASIWLLHLPERWSGALDRPKKGDSNDRAD